MVVFRTVLFLLLVAGLLCFAMYAGTGQRRWRDLGLMITKWTVIAAFGFFAVLITERLIA
jgi:predicted CDP-diglyceride synthetase/phosphatidate cytidylyltransferase